MANPKDEPLVSRKDLEQLIDGIQELTPYQEFLRKRWIGMVLWWHGRSVEARRKYFLLRAVVVTGGVLIPVLTTLSMRPGWQEFAVIAMAVVGALVAGCAAWEGFANYGEIWREKRRAAEMLKVEGWQFLQLCGKYQEYKNYKDAYAYFAAEVESMVAREVGEYLTVFDPSLAQAKKAAEDITNAIVDEAKKRIAQT